MTTKAQIAAAKALQALADRQMAKQHAINPAWPHGMGWTKQRVMARKQDGSPLRSIAMDAPLPPQGEPRATILKQPRVDREFFEQSLPADPVKAAQMSAQVQARQAIEAGAKEGVSAEETAPAADQKQIMSSMRTAPAPAKQEDPAEGLAKTLLWGAAGVGFLLWWTRS